MNKLTLEEMLLRYINAFTEEMIPDNAKAIETYVGSWKEFKSLLEIFIAKHNYDGDFLKDLSLSDLKEEIKATISEE
jgi:hypothetical protein